MDTETYPVDAPEDEWGALNIPPLPIGTKVWVTPASTLNGSVAKAALRKEFAAGVTVLAGTVVQHDPGHDYGRVVIDINGKKTDRYLDYASLLPRNED